MSRFDRFMGADMGSIKKNVIGFSLIHLFVFHQRGTVSADNVPFASPCRRDAAFKQHMSSYSDRHVKDEERRASLELIHSCG